MALTLPDCQQIQQSTGFNCSNPWPNCRSEKRFDFATLWNYTNLIYEACSNDSRLYRPTGLSLDSLLSKNDISLTQEACVAAAGGDWQRYPRSDIWTRLTTWKFPFLQLAAIFPRPPLSVAVESFVVFHLLGDPIDTIANLLRKLSKCQQWARYWQQAGFQGSEEGERDWRALTLITDAYAEWDEDERAKDILHDALRRFKGCPSLKAQIHKTAQALAADRATKSLPVFAAQIFFIVTIGVSIFRTADVANSRSSAFNNTVFVNVEAFSIAFSDLYIWIIPVVILSSFIGVSQTEAAIPRILGRFQDDLIHRVKTRNRRRRRRQQIHLPNACLADGEGRKFHGGIYQWQPSKSIDVHHTVLAHVIVIAGVVTGLTMSSLVPPGDFNCRHIGEIAIVAAWISSAYIDTLLNNMFPSDGKPWKFLKRSVPSATMLFRVTFAKDFVMTAATTGGIVLIQSGILNRCVCYSNWSRKGIALPQNPEVDRVLRERINSSYIAITCVGIGFQLILVSLYVGWRYSSAFRVYIQRDDQKSNSPDWLKKMDSKMRGLVSRRRSQAHHSVIDRSPEGNDMESGNGNERSSANGTPLLSVVQRPALSRNPSSRSPLLAVDIPSEHEMRDPDGPLFMSQDRFYD